MREQARAGLQSALDAAVTNGDTEAARKVAADIAKLEVSTAPKAPPFGDTEIRAQLDKQTWFGTDPKRSAKAVEFGKTMDPKKFPTAEAFADAIVKAVDEEFKPATAAKTEDEPNEDDEDEDEPKDDEAPKKAKRKTDGPGEADALGRPAGSRRSGPWTKLSDAPAEVQAEIKRTANKFAPKTKEGRDKYVARAVEAHYAAHLRTKGKK
jgi:hypothetical protein